MKFKKGLFLISISLLFAFTSCASNSFSSSVTRVSPDSTIDISGYWNDTDVAIVCDALIQSCITSPKIARFEDENGRAPTVKIGKIANKSSEHLDTKNIVNKFQTAILKSGVLEFVADNVQVAAVREEQASQADYATVESAASMFNEEGADFLLLGELRTIVDTNGYETVRTYCLTMQLIDVTTTKIIWQEENSQIKKYVKQAKYKY